ncbi:RNase A-like domain-containing protein [Thiomicrospira sp.]|uniref:RNase A-like domain-containing protein n=1 Tax=Thiomicrospira sp. TaxID=935 RepID=UPI002F92D8F3
MKAWLLVSLFSLLLVGCGENQPSENGGPGDTRLPIHVVLSEHEEHGHTIARHVAKTDAYLIERLQKNNKLNTVSTFSSLTMAEASVNAVLNVQRAEVADWWHGDLSRQAFFARVPTHGSYMTRAMLQQQGAQVQSQPVPQQAVVRVVLARKADGFYVLTAFPQPDN